MKPMQTRTNNKASLRAAESSIKSSTLERIDDETVEEQKKPYLLFPGGGLFFYWQAGLVEYLREKEYDLDNVHLGGASAGALTATLASTGVDFYEATKLALSKSDDAGIWDRKEGLQGIWGPLITTWLDELIPDDAVDKVNNRLSLLVTEIPSFRKKNINTFESKQDLIECNMASVHLPWFLDGKLTTTFRNAPHIDGSFLASAENFGVDPRVDTVLMPDYTKDPALGDSAFLDFVKTAGPDSIYELLEKGKAYGKLMEREGRLDCLVSK
eukprot:CAMPEP_0194203726 /NCGR_PEP_ID=MMETSP0156-20130528/3426_1 /TAXON_ID=33649 /ORGANISM="Thalassionema nitzschioides, Strain L26-B" /LENGTH=269 /DNA_ID=CAMNT_0038929531 /DNA_START=125 /DNA_END=934 /DNA_ORIENTATION=-